MNLVGLYLANPFWWWVGAAVALLAIEVATGAQMFLWPAVAAGVVALLQLLRLPLPLGADLAVFAILTIAGTLAARRLRVSTGGPDINDPLNRLVGQKGAAVAGFEHGQGRVLVEGTEWAAELDRGTELVAGERIEVTGVLDGGRLQVRALA